MLRLRTPLLAMGAGALAVAGVLSAPAAGAADGAVTVLASGLEGPREIQFSSDSKLVVAESDNGRVTELNVRNGRTKALATGLTALQGVDARGSALYVAQGETGIGIGDPTDPAQGFNLAEVKHGDVTLVSDLLAYEKANNPDGQAQYAPNGNPYESLSNPYYVLADTSKILVADAGANVVYSVDRKNGRTKTWFNPGVVTTGACEGLPNNPGTVGCDPVPTGIAKAPDGTYYVSTFQSEVPEAGRVYHVRADGSVIDFLDGFSSPTGVAVGDDGSVYVSEMLHGFPGGSEPPPPGADPSDIGRIIKVAPDAERTRTYAQVTMPSGLAFHDGALYASAWSVAVFIGMPSAGQVVRVGDAAFEPAA
ncbi:ScyD/ScyE family protein [Motilibacter aurantiacus]|uniref:ScyD/ScyE family protein n=1 Tax=Motilibacter aurantiacus TaxID=2714955 RepID=UPI00140C6DBD|nr:ScyD/ScyE family protein [Motilibacter aurantiacus]NHC44336.1 ScyD/ScyE family protein [Motilibacter aurantiacus]